MPIKILFSLFSLAQLTALAQRIRQLLIEKFPDHPMISTVLESIDSSLKLAIQAIGSTKKHSLTREVEAADLKRDYSFRSLRDHVESGLLRQNDSYRAACEALWIEFEKNGLKLYKVPYSEETAAIDSLLTDLSKPANLAHLATINALEWKDELERDNRAFEAAAKQRSASRSSDQTPTDKNAVRQLRTSLELVVSLLNTLYAMNTPEGIRETVEEVEQYISEATTAARISAAHVAGNEEEVAEV